MQTIFHSTECLLLSEKQLLTYGNTKFPQKKLHPLQKRDEVIIRGTTLIPMDTPRALCCCVTYSLRHSLLSKAKGFAASAPSQRRTLSYSGSGIQLAWEIRSSSELKRTFSRWFSLSDRKWVSTLHGHCFYCSFIIIYTHLGYLCTASTDTLLF